MFTGACIQPDDSTVQLVYWFKDNVNVITRPLTLGD